MKMIISYQFLLLSLLAFCFSSLAFGATTLPEEEVQALKDIAKTLGKKDWDFNTNPCSGQPKWVTLNPIKGEENNVSCDCSFANDNFCHVVTIVLKSQNLEGNPPAELIRLPHLQEIGFRRYLELARIRWFPPCAAAARSTKSKGVGTCNGTLTLKSGSAPEGLS